jgi:hypothetical protein
MSFIKLHSVPQMKEDGKFEEDDSLIIMELFDVKDVIKAFIYHVDHCRAYVRVCVYDRTINKNRELCYSEHGNCFKYVTYSVAQLWLNRLQQELNRDL